MEPTVAVGVQPARDTFGDVNTVSEYNVRSAVQTRNWYRSTVVEVSTVVVVHAPPGRGAEHKCARRHGKA
eukprot:2864745-Rhodomonas_salina.3